MEIHFGVDTLSYHCRLEAGDITHKQVLEEASALGFSFVQLNAYHLRQTATRQLDGLQRGAADLGLRLTLSGDVLGRASRGDTVESGVARVAAWKEVAAHIGSPFVRVSSGFYRNELITEPNAIAEEQRYVIDVLRAVANEGDAACQVVLENHSDFTPEEYVQIIECVGSNSVGVFLDLINPVTMLLDPLPVVERLFPLASAGHVKDFKLKSHYVEDGFHRRGFVVQYCYPGEGVANLKGLVGVIAKAKRHGEYYLSIEGLDNRPGIEDQYTRLRESLAHLTKIASVH